MHPKMHEHYEKELHFIREMGKEFAKLHPDAKQLDLEKGACKDPYVERLLEGFAFLTARIQLKLQSEYPKFTANLLNIVYPHYLSPTPSMTVVQFEPELDSEIGYTLKKGTRLRSNLIKNSSTRCDFRTTQDIPLLPLSIVAAKYLPIGEANSYKHSARGIKSGVSLQLKIDAGLDYKKLNTDSLIFYIEGNGDVPFTIYESLLAHCGTIVIQTHQLQQKSSTDASWQKELMPTQLKPIGFDTEQAMLPYTDVSFQGYRLLQEYLAFPKKYLFIELSGLQEVFQSCNEFPQALEIAFLFNTLDSALQGSISKDNFSLHCSPAINLFPKSADPIRLSHQLSKHHVIMDRNNSHDFEIYKITNVVAYNSEKAENQEFRPFYASDSDDATIGPQKYYTSQRIPHSDNKKKQTSEVYLSLVDAQESPYSENLKRIDVDTLCTNGGLTQHINKFELDNSVNVKGLRIVVTPTKAKPALVENESSWRLINHLTLNYLSITNTDKKKGADSLRKLLGLYRHIGGSNTDALINSINFVSSQPIVSRIPVHGPISFGRGVEITLECSENRGMYLLASVLERFFAKYVSLNSFIQTRLTTSEQGLIKQWPIRTGTRELL